jgi:hypothetical protein
VWQYRGSEQDGVGAFLVWRSNSGRSDAVRSRHSSRMQPAGGLTSRVLGEQSDHRLRATMGCCRRRRVGDLAAPRAPRSSGATPQVRSGTLELDSLLRPPAL